MQDTVANSAEGRVYIGFLEDGGGAFQGGLGFGGILWSDHETQGYQGQGSFSWPWYQGQVRVNVFFLSPFTVHMHFCSCLLLSLAMKWCCPQIQGGSPHISNQYNPHRQANTAT